MLAISANAAHAMTRIVAEHEGVGEDAGIRITHQPHGDHIDVAMEIRPAPEAGDQVVAEEGARVFLPPETADLLDDKLLEVQVDGQRLTGFALLDQG